MKIREAVLADAAAIAALTGELGYGGEAVTTREHLLRLLGGQDDVVFVAEAEGRLVGWIQAHASTALESGFRAEIVGLIVGTQDRRNGWGERLVAAVEEWGRARGANGVVVRSNIQRVESHEFYPALGYEKAKVQAVYRKRLER